MAQTAAPPQPQPDHPHVPTSDADRADEHEHNDNDGQPPKKRRFRQPLSCTECKRRKIRCDRNQPCTPCVRRGDQAKCQWYVIEPATEKYVFRAEHDALRARVDALDALVHGHQVPSPSLPLSHPHSHPHPLPPTFRPFTSHSSTSTTATPTKAQHPDHLYQALRTHSPRSSPVTHEARISPTEALTRISPVGARNEERTRDTAARPKNRSAQACHSQGARLRARGEPWAVRLCRPLRTRYLRTLPLRTMLRPGVLEEEKEGEKATAEGEKEETQESKGETSTARSASTLICTRRRPFRHPCMPTTTRRRRTHTGKGTHRICCAAPASAVAGGNCCCPGGRVPDRVRVDILSETLPWPKGARATPPLVLVDLPRCGGPAVVGGSICTAISSATRASGRF
ncbi:hypothetical protein B0H10DRAFT_870966 [Mycena sp. CBHHK59/15]|nr:hypothetical protein B0H10DRAFT_870966 [Mycena sp. CBHHK59/15]